MMTADEGTIIMTDIASLLNERQKTHGDFRRNFRISQRLKQVIREELAAEREILATAPQEAIDMIFHKIGRIIAGNASFRDHWDDIAGYAKLIADACEGDPTEPASHIPESADAFRKEIDRLREVAAEYLREAQKLREKNHKLQGALENVRELRRLEQERDMNARRD